MKNTRIWLSPPHLGTKEFEYIEQIFDSNWIAPAGPHIQQFEEQLSKISANLPTVALSSGTSAIHLALILLGVQSGDEVICSSFTFTASANPIVYQNATPIFIDSEADTWNMCPNLLREALEDGRKKNKLPKAIVLVHLYGMSAKMKEILAVSQEFEVPIIEDAAESLGGFYQEQPLGTLGEYGVYSFNGNKIITTSGGGALIGKKSTSIDRAKFLATQAREEAPHYEHHHIGYNYRLSNVCAGIGLGQLEVLNERVMKRRDNFEYYKKFLSHLTEISFLEEPRGTYSNRWLTTILLKSFDRERLRLALEEENIESRPLWKPLHMQPVYKDAKIYRGAVCESLFHHGLCLPSGSNLNKDDLDRVIATIKNTLEK